jgi:hypothetical protein
MMERRELFIRSPSGDFNCISAVARGNAFASRFVIPACDQTILPGGQSIRQHKIEVIGDGSHLPAVGRIEAIVGFVVVLGKDRAIGRKEMHKANQWCGGGSVREPLNVDDYLVGRLHSAPVRIVLAVHFNVCISQDNAVLPLPERIG